MRKPTGANIVGLLIFGFILMIILIILRFKGII